MPRIFLGFNSANICYYLIYIQLVPVIARPEPGRLFVPYRSDTQNLNFRSPPERWSLSFRFTIEFLEKNFMIGGHGRPLLRRRTIRRHEFAPDDSHDR